MLFGSPIGGIPGLVPPEVLIFFHIPKTVGMTMKGVVEHCFADQHFNAYLKYGGTALHVRSTAKVAEEFHKLPVENHVCRWSENQSSDEPRPPLNHAAICLKLSDDGQRIRSSSSSRYSLVVSFVKLQPLLKPGRSI